MTKEAQMPKSDNRRAQLRCFLRVWNVIIACLKSPTEIRSFRFGVPTLGGSHAVPPIGVTPNAIFRYALSRSSFVIGTLLLVLSCKAQAGPWPGWRGPDG